MEEGPIHVGAVRLRVVGSGSLQFTLYSIDDVSSQDLATLTMASVTKAQPTVLANFTESRVSLRVRVTELDEWFQIHRMLIFVKPIYLSVPQ